MRGVAVRLLCSFLTAAALLPGSASAATLDWQPRNTLVFIVGTLEWEDSETFASFPKTNRRDAQLARFFREKGVPPSRIVFLSDAEATKARVTSSFRKLLSQADEDDLLFFYYTGHGYQSEDGKTTYLATYDASEEVAGWSTDAIVRTIVNDFDGARVVIAVDCCHSGAFISRVKKLQDGPSFACLASSTAQEESTENWTFTEMLLAALRGKPYADLDQDGSVTLGELARGIKEDMKFAEDQVSTSVFTGEFDSSSVLAAAEKKRHPAIGRRVEVEEDGDWFKGRIIDVRDGKYRVHYYGYEVSDDQWVAPSQIRRQ
jgi:hypothetical protein